MDNLDFKLLPNYRSVGVANISLSDYSPTQAINLNNMDSNLPLNHQDAGNEYIGDDLHIIAGLTCVGQDEDGDLEYIGTKAQWAEYSRLVDEAESNDERLTTEHTSECAGCALCEE